MSSPRRERAGLLAGFALLGLMAVFCTTQLEIRTGLTHFLSDDSELRLARISRTLTDSPLTRRMILSISSPDPTVARDAAREWEAALRAQPEVARVIGGPDPEFARATYESYFPRRFLFLSDRPEAELVARFSDAGLTASAHALKRRLAGPESSWIKSIAARDPLLSFPDILTRFEAARDGPLRVVEGRFVVEDDRGTHAILFLDTRHSPFDAQHQAPLDAFVRDSFAALAARQPAPLYLERSAVHRFALASERQTRSDLTRIGGFSSLAIAASFLLLFRSFRPLLLASLPLASGILSATTLCILLFGGLHGMTLAFGATLIGICIDYPIHAINHHTLAPDPRGPRASFRQVWIGLSLGALTTVAGFAGLSFSNLPGIREIGVFASSGVLAALIATRIFLPPLLPAAPQPTPLHRKLARLAESAMQALATRRKGLVAILILALALCALGLPRVHFQDDLWSAGLPLDQSWLDEDERVRARVSRMDAGRFIIVFAESEEEALRVNDALYTRLAQAREEGLLEDFRSLHSFLWSAQLQKRNAQTLDKIPDLGKRTIESLDELGFRSSSFGPFLKDLDEVPDLAPLSLSELMGSPLRDIVSPFIVDMDGEIALLSFLRGVDDPAALSARLSDIPEAELFDQQGFLAETYARYRVNTQWLILLGLGLVSCVVFLRYRSLSNTVTAIGPALLAAASSLALLALAGVPISLFHLLGTLLTLSFGVDYSVFLMESERRGSHLAATLLSLCMACLSTLLAFGLLGASPLPALQALGLSTGMGVLLALLLAPTALLLARDVRHAPEGDHR